MYRGVPLVEDYYYWLISIVKPEEQKPLDYDDVLYALFATEFYSKLDNDDNRIGDGLKLRDEYGANLGLSEGILRQLYDMTGPCSVLEVMIALAKRAEDEFMYDPNLGDRTKKWFWIMVKNLKLDVLAHPWPTFGPLLEGKSGPKKQFQDIVEDFLERRYKKNGEGGLFRVNKGNIDMRKTEIWYQMCWFFDENFDFS